MVGWNNTLLAYEFGDHDVEMNGQRGHCGATLILDCCCELQKKKTF